MKKIAFPKASAEEIIAHLDLRPHPEGGHYRETWRAHAAPGARAAGTAIYFLLMAGEVSAWHRIDAAEIWHWYAGAPLRLRMASQESGLAQQTLGSDFLSGECPQAIVPPFAWQQAESLGDWTLVGCTVSPGFDFATFELAPQGWTPQGL